MILSLLLFMSLAQAAGKRAPVSVPSAIPTPAPSVIVLPDPSPSPVIVSDGALINIGKISGATAAETKMIIEGAALANAMLDKPCFEEWITSASYTENNGLTQVQILSKVQHQVSTIDVEMYTGSWSDNHVSKTVGYENDPFDGVVHMNRYFVDSAYMVGDNLIHEDRGHSLGFHHYGAHYTSEPYGMNLAYEGCSQAQQMQVLGAKPYRPPGLRLQIRHKKKAA